MLVYDVFGGTIHRIHVDGGGTHYFNKINGHYFVIPTAKTHNQTKKGPPRSVFDLESPYAMDFMEPKPLPEGVEAWALLA